MNKTTSSKLPDDWETVMHQGHLNNNNNNDYDNNNNNIDNNK